MELAALKETAAIVVPVLADATVLTTSFAAFRAEVSPRSSALS